MDADDDRASRLDEANAALQSRLEEEKAARREERFLWLIAVLGLFDLLLFDKEANSALVLVIAALQLIILYVLARRLGIANLIGALDTVLTAWAGEAKPKPD